MINLIERFESYRTFTTNEAWGIFKVTALAEAVGWTMLITGLAINHFNLPGSAIAVPIAGQIHGTIFIVYFMALIFIYPSLRWSRAKTILAFVAGVIPYGTLIFELVANKQQKDQIIKFDHAYLVVKKNNRVLVAQPSHGINWILPGIDVLKNQATKTSISSLLNATFNIKCDYQFMYSIKNNAGTKDYYYSTRSNMFDAVDLVAAAKKEPLIDEYAFVKLSEVPAIKDLVNMH